MLFWHQGVIFMGKKKKKKHVPELFYQKLEQKLM